MPKSEPLAKIPPSSNLKNMKQLEVDKNIQRYLGAVELNMALGDAEAQNQLEEKVALALPPLVEARKHLEESEHKEIDLLRTAIDELRVQFALGKMEGADTLEEIEGRIAHGFSGLKNSVRKAKRLTGKEAEELNESLHKGWRKLKLEINILYLRLELAHETGSEKFDTARKELIEDVKQIAELGKEEAEEAAADLGLWLKQVKMVVQKRALKVVKSMENYLLDAQS